MCAKHYKMLPEFAKPIPNAHEIFHLLVCFFLKITVLILFARDVNSFAVFMAMNFIGVRVLHIPSEELYSEEIFCQAVEYDSKMDTVIKRAQV